MTFLGAGIGLRRVHHDALLAARGDARPAALEVIPDHFFADVGALAALADAYPIVLHDVGVSLGTASKNDVARARLERIKEVCRHARPRFFTEHVAMTRAPSGIDLGHLLPLHYTRAQLDVVVDRVRALMDTLSLPVALENIAAPFVIPGADYSEPEFFHRLVERTGCGVLLDVSNLVVNAKNFGFDAAARLLEYPLHAVWQVHLAGGILSKGWWVDSHSTAVHDESFALLGRLKRSAPDVVTLIVERDDRIPPLEDLVAEARRAQEEWERA